jgi:hypothetical protein
MSEAAAIVGPLLTRIREIWRTARIHAARSVNSALLQSNWLIGQQILEAEQGGFARAEYGGALLKTLSQQLIKEFGNGFWGQGVAVYAGLLCRLPVTDERTQHAARVESGAVLADGIAQRRRS